MTVICLFFQVPADPKTEWGFTADDAKDKIEELCRQEGVPVGTPHKNISLSKIGAILGLKTVRTFEYSDPKSLHPFFRMFIHF